MVVVALGFLIPRVLVLKDVRCASQFGPCSPEIEQEAQKLRGKSLYDGKEYLKKNLAKLTRVTKYSTRFGLPNKLSIDVIERKAYAAINVNNSYILIDQEGVTLGKVDSTNLPVVKSDTEKVSNQMLVATQLMDDLYTLYGVKSGSVTQDYLHVDGVEGKSVIFPLTSERDLLVGSLRFILSRLKVEPFDPRINLIDLRYKNPVLR